MFHNFINMVIIEVPLVIKPNQTQCLQAYAFCLWLLNLHTNIDTALRSLPACQLNMHYNHPASVEQYY
jgi:hypothetical protein